jgi:hypothetical protein
VVVARRLGGELVVPSVLQLHGDPLRYTNPLATIRVEPLPKAVGNAELPLAAQTTIGDLPTHEILDVRAA